MATCAVCLSPILEPQRFVVDGTEVLHRACAQASHTTVLQRAQRATAAALHEAANAQRRELELRSKVATLEGRIARYEADLSSIRRDMRVALRHHGITRTERDTAIDERDAARREAALYQTLAAARQGTPSVSSAPDSTASSAGPVAPAERDPTEQRMSLLELDPL